MKITFALIVFNADYVLKQVLESIYPFAHKIIVVDGVVKYWADQGYTGSTDQTRQLVIEFPDPDNKIILHRNVIANEKTELCQRYMGDVPEDTDYLWTVDGDEVYTEEAIKKTIEVLEAKRPTSVSFRSLTFYGGFKDVLGGFEEKVGFKRLLKYERGCTYIEHRPPTLSVEKTTPPGLQLHISSDEMADIYGVFFYHYSYVFPFQVKSKIAYYKAAVSKHNCIDNYFHQIYLPWVLGDDARKKEIEDQWNGVHEFVPSYRGECRTKPFLIGDHPESIKRSMTELVNRFEGELEASMYE